VGGGIPIRRSSVEIISSCLCNVISVGHVHWMQNLASTTVQFAYSITSVKFFYSTTLIQKYRPQPFSCGFKALTLVLALRFVALALSMLALRLLALFPSLERSNKF